MPVQMFDSVTPEAIPKGATYVASYIRGEGAKTPAQMAALGFSKVVWIEIDPAENDGDVLDCERGNIVDPQIDPGRAVDWVLLRRGLGFMNACCYVNASNLHFLVDAFSARKVMQPLYWVADWGPPTRPHLIPNSAATQYISPETGSPGNYDISWCSDVWPAILFAPLPPPPPIGDTMPGVSEDVTDKASTRHRARVRGDGTLIQMWNPLGSGVWLDENIAEIAGNTANPPSPPVAALTFDPDQVPTIVVKSGYLIIAAVANVDGDNGFEFFQPDGGSGWSVAQLDK